MSDFYEDNNLGVGSIPSKKVQCRELQERWQIGAEASSDV